MDARHALDLAFGGETLVEAFRLEGFVLFAPWGQTRLPPIGAVLDRFGTIPDPRVVLTSIHGSKGREADSVLVIADHTYRTHDAYLNGGLEETNRLYYVAATRTKDRLVLVRPQSNRAYPFPRLDR